MKKPPLCVLPLLGLLAFASVAAEGEPPSSHEVTAAMKPYLDSDKHVLLKPLVRPVTVRHVLSHTSGLTGSAEVQRETGSDRTPLNGRAHSSVTGPWPWQPGDKYQYGNQGMNIAARIVEIVSGMPDEDFLQQSFFDPLGMTETKFWPSDPQIARLAGADGPNKEGTGFAQGGIGFLTKPYSDRAHRFPEAGGGLFSTTRDLFLKTATDVYDEIVNLPK